MASKEQQQQQQQHASSRTGRPSLVPSRHFITHETPSRPTYNAPSKSAVAGLTEEHLSHVFWKRWIPPRQFSCNISQSAIEISNEASMLHAGGCVRTLPANQKVADQFAVCWIDNIGIAKHIDGCLLQPEWQWADVDGL